MMPVVVVRDSRLVKGLTQLSLQGCLAPLLLSSDYVLMGKRVLGIFISYKDRLRIHYMHRLSVWVLE